MATAATEKEIEINPHNETKTDMFQQAIFTDCNIKLSTRAAVLKRYKLINCNNTRDLFTRFHI